MKINVLGVEKNKLGSLLTMNFFNIFFKKIQSLIVSRYPLSRCRRPKLSFFYFSPAFEILATPQGLTGAAKVLNLTLYACKLSKCLMKDYTTSSILKSKVRKH